MCFKIELNFNRIRKYPMYLINMTITSVYNMAHRARMDCELRVIDANYDHVAQGIIFSVWDEP